MILFVFTILLSVLWYYQTEKLDQNFYTIPQIENRLYLLEDNYRVIKNELEQAQLRWLKWPETYLYEDNNWSVVPIYAFNKWIPKYKIFFPLTIDIISKIPRVQTILFSRIKSHTIIDPHQGWASLSNRILRCHLPIRLQKGTNFIAVDNEKRYHQEGKLIIFDDAKMHYSVNKTDGDRIVLIIDITRPDHVREGRSRVSETPELLDLLKRI